MSRNADTLAFIGRCLIAVLLLVSGFTKAIGPGATIAWIASTGLPMPAVGYVVFMTVELVGGVLLILGWQTRPVAVVVSVYAILTAFVFHRHVADPDQLFNFLKNVAVTGGLFQLMAFGPGNFSLDARRLRKSPA
jgi:putative oxidoreductase